MPVTTADDFVEGFWSGVTPRTRVIFLSHITSPTALIFPIKEICRRAREAGIISIIDGAHAIGQIPLDLQQISADFYSSNLHKWMCCPKGSAFLTRARKCKTSSSHWLSVGDTNQRNQARHDSLISKNGLGPRDIAAYLATPEAIRFYEEHHWNSVRIGCHELAHICANELRRSQVCRHSVQTRWTGICKWFPCHCHPATRVLLQARLYDEFRIEVPIVVWRNKPYIRISIQAYNTQEDAENLIQVLANLLGL